MVADAHFRGIVLQDTHQMDPEELYVKQQRIGQSRFCSLSSKAEGVHAPCRLRQRVLRRGL